MDMVDVSVLGEADAESSSTAGLGADGILESLCDSKGYVAAQLRELPAQLTGHAVGNSGTWRNVPAALRPPGLVCCDTSAGTLVPG